MGVQPFEIEHHRQRLAQGVAGFVLAESQREHVGQAGRQGRIVDYLDQVTKPAIENNARLRVNSRDRYLNVLPYIREALDGHVIDTRAVGATLDRNTSVSDNPNWVHSLPTQRWGRSMALPSSTNAPSESHSAAKHHRRMYSAVESFEMLRHLLARNNPVGNSE